MNSLGIRLASHMGIIDDAQQIYTVLVIDDDKETHDQIRHDLEDHYQLLTATDGRTGLRMLHSERPHVVILDLNLGEDKENTVPLNGYDICQRIRELSDIPIVVFTTEDSDEVLIDMLNRGADDFVVKDGNLQILQARLNATLRRLSLEQHDERLSQIYNDGWLTINLPKRRITRDGDVMRLSPIEYRLLSELLRHSPKPVGYQELLTAVWGADHTVSISYLRVYAWHLRKKLEVDHAHPEYIINEPGVGYRFNRKA